MVNQLLKQVFLEEGWEIENDFATNPNNGYCCDLVKFSRYEKRILILKLKELGIE